MKKVVSLILVVLTIITVMFVGSVSASAGGSGGFPTRTRAQTVHTSYAEAHKHVPTHITTEVPDKKASPALGSTVNEINPSTYIIVAIGILIVVLVSVMLIGYNVKKKKKSAAEDNAEKDEE